MKYLLFTLTCLVLFSCTKKEEPIITFTVTQNAVGEMILHADISGISKKQINVCGFSCGLSENHDITSSQVYSDQPNSTSITKTMSNYCFDLFNCVPFSPNTTYYFTCFIGTTSGKIYRTKAKAITAALILPCSISPNTYSVTNYWTETPVENGITTNAVLTGTAGGGLYKIYSVNFGSYTFNFKFKGDASTQVYTTTNNPSSFALNEVYIENYSTGSPLNYVSTLYVTNNNNGTFTMVMCSGSSYDSGYPPSEVVHSFNITGNY
jgi:hypothetical protein